MNSITLFFQVLCVITAPITLIIKSQQDASYAFVALAIILCSFLSMGVIFGPKVGFLQIYHFGQPIIYKEDLKECSCIIDFIKRVREKVINC